jgi:hypothetical protein
VAPGKVQAASQNLFLPPTGVWEALVGALSGCSHGGQRPHRQCHCWGAKQPVPGLEGGQLGENQPFSQTGPAQLLLL